jgi:WD40 repeat protein
MFATADDFGTVKIFRNPSAGSTEDPHKVYYGHSSHVTSVKFSNWSNQSILVSTGGEDKTVMQWKVHNDNSKVNRSFVQTQAVRPKSAGISQKSPHKPASQRPAQNISASQNFIEN